MLTLSLQNIVPLDIQPDAIELRLDLFPKIDREEIAAFMRAHPSIPFIFTLKNSSSGGQFYGEEKERLQILQRLLSLHPAFIDLEHDIDPHFIREIAGRFPKTKIILSYHNFTETPQDLQALMKKIFSPCAFGYKIACMALSSIDALRLLLFAREQKEHHLSAIALGNIGAFSRALGPIFGNFFNFSYLTDPTGPGQISMKELIELYHYRSLSNKTALYGLIGASIDRSFSHLLHNSLFIKYGIDAIYVKMAAQPEELPTFFSLIKQCGFSGLSVTMPLKQQILPLLDELDSKAAQIGAINTVHFKNGKAIGYNTDGKAAIDALEIQGKVYGKTILLLGAGGAAHAIAFEGKLRGAKIYIFNRSQEKAALLAQKTESHAHLPQDYDILINATPVDNPLELSFLKEGKQVMDIRTRPMLTGFLRMAQHAGCSLIYGYEMLLRQALHQFRLWQNLQDLKSDT